MKKLDQLIGGVLIVLASACADPQGKPENAKSVASAQASAIEPVLYFKASGNEPGWNIQMSASDAGTFPVVIVLDYGADTLRATVQKQPIMESTPDSKGKPTVGSNEAKYSGMLEESDANETIEVAIVSGFCSDDADKNHGAQVTVRLKDQVLTGCGDYME